MPHNHDPRLRKRWQHVHFRRKPMSIENYWIEMTQDHKMMRNFSRINKSTCCLTSVFQKTSIGFLKDLRKMYSFFVLVDRFTLNPHSQALPSQIKQITLALVSCIRGLVVRALHQYRKGLGLIPAGGPIVDEFFPTVPAFWISCVWFPLDIKKHLIIL